MKYLIILVVLGFLVYLLLSSIIRKFKRFFQPFTGQQDKVNHPDEQKGEVIYKKDDVVVLKGEAGEKKKKPNSE